MFRIAAVKFRDAGKLYDFDAGTLELSQNERVVVETDRGRALGSVVVPPRERERDESGPELKKILRKATDEDLALAQKHAEQEEEARRFCMQRIKERRMDMKLVQAEYLFDGSKIVFYFTADGRVDFRELVKDLAHHFHTRIEMRQIGVRDEAKMIGGIGICGRELCCCTFLRDFNPVSVKMAKEQGLALNPSKISGQCGRLLCCLGYEFETYGHLRRALPKIGKKVTLDGRQAEITGTEILKQQVTVRFENGEEMRLSVEEIRQGEIAPKPEELPPEEDKPPTPRLRKPTAEAGAKKEPKPRSEPQDGKEDQGKGSARPRRRSRGQRKKEAAPASREQQAKSAEPGEQKPRKGPDKSKDNEVRSIEKKRRRPRRRPRSKKPTQGDKE